MNSHKLNGASKALLHEYNKVIAELIHVVSPLTNSELVLVVDTNTTDPNCQSIQTILSHVIHSGYTYTTYIENHLGLKTQRPQKIYFDTTTEYTNVLYEMYTYCENCFIDNANIKLEETDSTKKITTNWKQLYDVEQLMEHAIVHILRHRLQIEKFIKKQQSGF
jgi:uncharacterized damage-inducible protein DinB